MRHMIRVAIVVPLLLIGALALPVNATSTLVISGKVENGTAGAALPTDLEITAAQLTTKGAETDRRSTRLSPDGTFRIDGFTAENGSHYVVATTYLSVTYSTVVDANGGNELSAQIKVFETTSDDSDIDVVSDSLTIIQGKQDNLELLQLIRLRNRSDRTFVGRFESGKATVVRFPVVPNASDLSPGEGITADRVSSFAGGFAGGDPLQPGESDFSYSYNLKVPRFGWSIERAVFYPTERIDLLTGPGLRLQASGFRFKERKKFGDAEFQRFRGGPFRVGQAFLADMGYAGGDSKRLYLGLGAMIAFLIGAMIFGSMIMRSRRKTRTRSSSGALERQQLIEAIAELDEAFATGQIDEPNYTLQRTEIKRQIVDATDQLVD